MCFFFFSKPTKGARLRIVALIKCCEGMNKWRNGISNNSNFFFFVGGWVMQTNQPLLWLLGNSLAYRNMPFPLYWVLIVDFSDWMAASPRIMMPYHPPYGESQPEMKGKREETEEMKAMSHSFTPLPPPSFFWQLKNKVYPGSCVWAGEGKLNKYGVRQRIGHHRSLSLKTTTDGAHPEQREFCRLQKKRK